MTTDNITARCTEVGPYVVHTMCSPVVETYIHVTYERIIGKDGDSWWRTHPNVTSDELPVTNGQWLDVIRLALPGNHHHDNTHLKVD